MRELISGLARAEPQLFWLCAGGAGLIALCGLWTFVRALRRAGEALAEPTAAIRSAAQSHLTIEGRARSLGEPVRAPLSNRSCLWWRYTIAEKRREGWQAIERHSSSNLFALEDESGSCLVDPAGAEVAAVPRRRWHGRTPSPSGFGMPALLARYRYQEELIRERTELRATGLLRTARAAEGGYFDETEETEALLAAWRLDQQKLLRRSDADAMPPKVLADWEAKRRHALRALHDDQIERGIRPGLHVLSKPVDGRPFLLSAMPQHKVVSRCRWRAFFGFLLMLAGLTAAAWLWLARSILPAS